MIRKAIHKVSTKINRSLFKLTDSIFPSETVDGILIVNGCDETEGDVPFIPTVKAALALIKASDWLRYARILSSLETIRNLPTETHPNYQPMTRSCHLNLQKYAAPIRSWFDNKNCSDEMSEQVLIAEIARTIVHEATHGYLWDRGIEYGEDVWRRVERRCRREEILFSRNGLSETPGYAGGTMDWKYWCEFSQEIEEWYAEYVNRSRYELWREKQELLWRGESSYSMDLDLTGRLPMVVDLEWFQGYTSRLEKALSDPACDPAALTDRAERWTEIGLHDRAVADCRDANILSPENELIRGPLLQALTSNDRWDEAHDLAEEWFADSQSALGLHWLAWCRLRLDHPQAATPLEKLALHKGLGESTRSYYKQLLARPMVVAGAREKALQHLEDCWSEGRCLCGLMDTQHNILMLEGNDIDALERREWFLRYRCDAKVVQPELWRRLPAFITSSSHVLEEVKYSSPIVSMLIGCDEELLGDPQQLVAIARKLRERMNNKKTNDSERLYLQTALEGCRNGGARCFLIPQSWTDGHSVYATSGSLPRPCLSGGVLNHKLVWMMAQPLEWITDENQPCEFKLPYAYSTETEFANMSFGAAGVFPAVSDVCVTPWNVPVQ